MIFPEKQSLDFSGRKKYYMIKDRGDPIVATNDTEALGRFDRLEERIIRLLEANSSISAENKTMRELLAARDREVARLMEKIEKLGKEKEAVKEKVDTLLKRLDSLV